MSLKWAASLDQLWQTPGLMSLLAIVAAIFFALVVIVIAFRADRTVANVALVVVTLIAAGGMTLTTFRGASDREAPVITARAAPSAPSLAALACLDGLAGEGVESACERALFATADAAAAAVSYTASQVSRLTPADALTSRNQTPEGTALRRSIERDRFGLVAQVLTVREGCTPASCALFRILSDPSRIIANMNDRAYENTVGRYALAWGGMGGSTVASAPSQLPSAPAAPVASAPAPTGRPSSVDFPSAASTPPVNIMIGEVPSSPILPTARAPVQAPKQAPPPQPKKQVAKQKAPVQLTPKAGEAEADEN